MSEKRAFIARVFAPNTFLTAVSSLISAGALGQLVLLGVMPMITRLYTPSEFGIAAVFGALLGIMVISAGLRYEYAIGLPKIDRHAELIVRFALALALISGISILLCVAIWRAPIAEALSVPELTELLWLLPVVVFVAAGYRIFNFWALRQSRFGLIARTRLIQPMANAATQVGAGFAGMGALGLVMGQAVGSVAGVTSLSRGFRVWRLPSARELGEMAILVRRYSRFPRLDVPAGLVDALGVQLPNLLLAMLFSPVVAGLYLLADRVIVYPLSLVGQAVGQVIYARSRGDVAAGRFHAVIIKIVKILAAGIVVPGLVVVLFAPAVFEVVFGTQWRMAGVYASILFAGFAAQFIYSAISMTLPVTNGQHLNLAINVGLLLAKFAALYHGYLNGGALVAIIGFSLVAFIGNIIAIGVVIAHVRRQPVSVWTDIGLEEN